MGLDKERLKDAVKAVSKRRNEEDSDSYSYSEEGIDYSAPYVSLVDEAALTASDAWEESQGVVRFVDDLETRERCVKAIRRVEWSGGIYHSEALEFVVAVFAELSRDLDEREEDYDDR